MLPKPLVSSYRLDDFEGPPSRNLRKTSPLVKQPLFEIPVVKKDTSFASSKISCFDPEIFQHFPSTLADTKLVQHDGNGLEVAACRAGSTHGKDLGRSFTVPGCFENVRFVDDEFGI